MDNVNLIFGDFRDKMLEFDDDFFHFIITSPPYYNAREYAQYTTYDEYLGVMEEFVKLSYQKIVSNRFIAINISPVLVPRKKRSDWSRRKAIHFDFHKILIDNGFEYYDDIVWVKPSGAAKGRNRRFYLDRQPLQYKPNVVTEYILIYRKDNDQIIDKTIRSYSDDIREMSLIDIDDSFESTNVWKFSPSRNNKHPAVYPQYLSDRLIEYYTYVGDRVLDPFCGSGTSLLSCRDLNRIGYGIEFQEEYYNYAKSRIDG